MSASTESPTTPDALKMLVNVLASVLERAPKRRESHEAGNLVEVEEGVQVGEPFLKRDVQSLTTVLYSLMSNADPAEGSLEAEACKLHHVEFPAPFEKVWHIETSPDAPPSGPDDDGWIFPSPASVAWPEASFATLIGETTTRGFDFALVRLPWPSGPPAATCPFRWRAYGRSVDGELPYHRRLIGRAVQLLIEADYPLTRLVSAMAAEAFLAELIEREMIRLRRPEEEIKNATRTTAKNKLAKVKKYRPEQYAAAKKDDVLARYRTDVGEPRDSLGHGMPAADMESARLAVMAIKSASELILAFPPLGEGNG